MPLKIIRRNQTQLVGRGQVLLAVLPMRGQSRELYTGKIVEEAALLSKAHALISEEPKLDSISDDFAKNGSEFEDNLQNIIEDNQVECVLEISGMNDVGVEIRVIHSGLQTEEIVRTMTNRFGQRFAVKASNAEEVEGTAKLRNVQTISIALGPEERGFQKDAAISIISDLVGLINGELGKSESDETTSDVLD